ncbi:response regulator [Pseudobacteriovorax antillogorgiicola]|uniref:Response regulator receiver domain-containing protein n=1 Tax=Pseudobacteriovorax antillogorgiicola TaxID=1513793 RepID=A0A1Y6CPI5_9BACT|nr:response regulator [Pseudobacteriovorax antillogorgiicola]TCS42845.1 response regulator receiver domain-containing protein [Pseudobacteriovorax antillogorgiicola]SMF81836.1 Response regulator receiver domain-containing protein [Pseudobacteriovorax antillogorgiicola]
MDGKILLVDDDPTSLEIMAQLLKDHYHITTAPDGEAALNILASDSFDLVITDLVMPKVDGWELMERGPQGKVVLCSGKNKLPDEVNGIPVIKKPFDYDAILALVKDLVGRQREAS